MILRTRLTRSLLVWGPWKPETKRRRPLSWKIQNTTSMPRIGFCEVFKMHVLSKRHIEHVSYKLFYIVSLNNFDCPSDKECAQEDAGCHDFEEWKASVIGAWLECELLWWLCEGVPLLIQYKFLVISCCLITSKIILGFHTPLVAVVLMGHTSWKLLSSFTYEPALELASNASIAGAN